MSDYIFDVAFRAAVSIPVGIAVMSLTWAAKRKFNPDKTIPAFNAAKIRTWPFSRVVTNAVAFGALFSVFSAAIGQTMIGMAIAAAASAYICGALLQAIHRAHGS